MGQDNLILNLGDLPASSHHGYKQYMMESPIFPNDHKMDFYYNGGSSNNDSAFIMRNSER